MNKILLTVFSLVLFSCQTITVHAEQDRTILGSWFYDNNLMEVTHEKMVFTYLKKFNSYSDSCPIVYLDEKKAIVDCPEYNMNNYEFDYAKETDNLIINGDGYQLLVDRIPEIEINELFGRWIDVEDYESSQTVLITVTTQYEFHYDFETYDINHKDKTYTYFIESVKTNFTNGNTFVDNFDGGTYKYQLVSKKQDKLIFVAEDGYMWSSKKYFGEVREDYIDMSYKLIENKN